MSTAMPLPIANVEREPDAAIRVLVVQHEILLAQAFVDLLQDEGGFYVLECCHDVEAAGVAIRHGAPELVIADAFIAKELKGVLRSVCLDPAPVTIFTGAAHRGGDVPPVAVALLAGGDCLELALVRAKAEVQHRRLRQLGRRLRSLGPAAGNQRFAVRSDDRIVFVRHEEVDWIQAAGNYVRLHVGEAAYPIRLTMSRMELLLDPGNFMRVHRNAIVNLDRVLEFQIPSTGNMFVVLRNGKHLPLSRGYQGDLRAFLCRSLGVPSRLPTPAISGDPRDESCMPAGPDHETQAFGQSVH